LTVSTLTIGYLDRRAVDAQGTDRWKTRENGF
jgi:hypothetical protein